MTDAKLTARFRARLDRLLALFCRELRGALDVPTVTVPTTDGFPQTVGEALDRVAADADTYSSAAAEHLQGLVALLVPPKYRDAVLAPGRQVAELWPWPAELKHTTLLSICAGLYPVADADSIQTRKRLLDALNPPVEYNPAEVTERFKDALNAASPGAGDAVLQWAEHSLRCVYMGPAERRPKHPHVHPWPLSGTTAHHDGRRNEVRCLPEHLALLDRAVQDVNRDLRRQVVAIDATPAHHNFLVGWGDLPKNRETVKFPTKDGRIELIPPTGRREPVQLTLDIPGVTLQEALTNVLCRLRGWKGLRHWAALQRLFSIEGGRQGWVRWTLDEHLDAMGYRDRSRRDPEVRMKSAREVELLTSLELAVYEPNGQERSRDPLIHVGRKHDRLEGSQWLLDGMELRINPLLYRGVRDPRTRKLGSKFFPVPAELPTISHTHHPYAYPLGLILPCRWQWDLLDPKKHTDHTALSGRSLLTMAGIPFNKHKPSEAWSKLERNLEQLQRIELLDRAVWDAGRPSLEGTCRLYPVDWLVDRAVRGLRPLELPPKDVPLTGKELREWRKARGLTQAETAKRLEISMSTVQRAESKPDKRLTRNVRDALARRG